MRLVLVTGSTDGIGQETACRIAAKEGYHVIVHGRSEERCEKTIAFVKQQNANAKLDYIVCDFADLTNVPKMVEEIKERFPKLSSIVCNAGVLLPERQVSVNGYEMTFQVNHLAHFVLINMLLDVLKDNSPARIVVVSSICYDWYPMDWDDLMAENNYEKYTQYSRTKLANHLFTFALARRLENSKITCNVYEPGVVETKLLRAGGYSGAPAWTGSVTAVHLVTSDDVAELSGSYFDKNQQKVTPSADSRDENAQEKLWQISIELCKKVNIDI